MGTTYVSMKAPDIEKIAGKDTAFDPKKLSTHVVNILLHVFADKKKYSSDIPVDGLFEILHGAVGDKLLNSIKTLAKPITLAEVYTNTSVFSRESKLFLKYEANKKKGDVELVADWKGLKSTVAEINNVLKDEAPEKLTYVDSLAHPNLYTVIAPKLSEDARQMFAGTVIKLDVKITDPETVAYLSKNRENLLLLQKATDAADFGKIGDDVAKVLNSAAEMVKKDPNKQAEAKKLADTAVPKAVEMAVVAAAAKIRLDRTKYFLKAAYEITMNFVTIATSSAKLAATHGADVMAYFEIIKAVVDTAKKIYDLAKTVNMAGAEYKAVMKAVKLLYDKQSPTAIGTVEAVQEIANTWLPNVFPSIKQARTAAESWEHKINGVEVASESASKKVNEALAKVQKLEKGLKTLERLMSDPKFARRVPLMEQKAQQAAEKVTALLEKIITMNGKVVDLRVDYKTSTEDLEEFEKLVPDWAKIAIACSKIAKALTGIETAMTHMTEVAEIAVSSIEIANNSREYMQSIKETIDDLDK